MGAYIATGSDNIWPKCNIIIPMDIFYKFRRICDKTKVEDTKEVEKSRNTDNTMAKDKTLHRATRIPLKLGLYTVVQKDM